METDSTSEWDFLLTELHYTLDQLHAQLQNLDHPHRTSEGETDATIDAFLANMLRYEAKYQSQYAGTAHSSIEELPGLDEFGLMRERTIAKLRETGAEWSRTLLDTVKQQVADDRYQMTQIAEYRRQLFENDSGPEVDVDE